jgi:FtsZ-interacting cell division protein ZipA
MIELANKFLELFQNPQNIIIGAIAVIILLFIIIFWAGSGKKKQKTIGIPQDLQLEQVMEHLRESASQSSYYVEEQKDKVREQEREFTEKQMQLQKLEEQLLQMKHELRLLDDAPQEVRDKFIEINERTAQEVKRKIQVNGFRMLMLGFFIAGASYILGSFFSSYREDLTTWVLGFFNP